MGYDIKAEEVSSSLGGRHPSNVDPIVLPPSPPLNDSSSGRFLPYHLRAGKARPAARLPARRPWCLGRAGGAIARANRTVPSSPPPPSPPPPPPPPPPPALARYHDHQHPFFPSFFLFFLKKKGLAGEGREENRKMKIKRKT
ncbi:hypothetical protein L209DRAFT_243847 [Thermothelomyces heterothallicus CBS 203.75]